MIPALEGDERISCRSRRGQSGSCPPAGFGRGFCNRMSQTINGERFQGIDVSEEKIMLRRDPAAGVRAFLVWATLLAAGSGPVFADRHCAPVIEAYWRARTFLMQEGQACVELLRASGPDFEEAVAQAKICGFMPLHRKLDELLLSEQPKGAAQCRAKVKRILEFGSVLHDLVEAYH